MRPLCPPLIASGVDLFQLLPSFKETLYISVS